MPIISEDKSNSVIRKYTRKKNKRLVLSRKRLRYSTDSIPRFQRSFIQALMEEIKLTFKSLYDLTSWWGIKKR